MASASPLRAANREPTRAEIASVLKTPPRHDAIQAACEAADVHSNVAKAQAAETAERHDHLQAALEVADLFSAHKKQAPPAATPPTPPAKPALEEAEDHRSAPPPEASPEPEVPAAGAEDVTEAPSGDDAQVRYRASRWFGCLELCGF